MVAETLVEGSPSGGILCQVMVLKEGGVGITEFWAFRRSEWPIRRTHKSERSYAQVGTLVRTSRNARTHKSERSYAQVGTLVRTSRNARTHKSERGVL